MSPGSSDRPQNGWNEWSRHVLAELTRLSDAQGEIAKELAEIKTDLALLKFKAVFFGAVTGTACAVLFEVVVNRVVGP